MTITLKRALLLVFSLVIILSFIVGCSNSNTDEDVVTTKPITTDSAVIKEADAINLIKTYTASELGLEGSLEDYRIMVGNSGEELDGKYYVKVIASKISEPDADGTVSIDTYGQYFISYNGAEILVYNEAENTYTPMQDIHDVPESNAPAHSHSNDE